MSFVWLWSTDYSVVIVLCIIHSSFSSFKYKSRAGYKWFSALHSRSRTNVGPKMWRLPSSSSSHGWRVEWIRICLPSGNHVPDPRLLKNSAKLLWPQRALGHVCCSLLLLYTSHLEKGLCHAVTHKDDTHFLLCFQTDPLGKNLQESLASKAAVPAHKEDLVLKLGVLGGRWWGLYTSTKQCVSHRSPRRLQWHYVWSQHARI